MAVLLRLYPLLLLLPIADLLLLVWLGQRIGFAPTLTLVIGTGVLGTVLGKREGLRVLRSFRQAALEHRMPEEGVLSGVLVLLGAALLLFPGVISDVVGLVLLVPATRRPVAAFLRRRIERRIVVFGGPRRARDQVIDVERGDR